jgi:hypothetical protein
MHIYIMVPDGHLFLALTNTKFTGNQPTWVHQQPHIRELWVVRDEEIIIPECHMATRCSSDVTNIRHIIITGVNICVFIWREVLVK